MQLVVNAGAAAAEAASGPFWTQPTLVPAVASALAAALSAFVAMESWRIARRANVSSALKEYLSAYEKVVDYPPAEAMRSDVKAYETGKVDKVAHFKLDIAVALLIGLLDAMVRNKDPRLGAWKRFLHRCSGPIVSSENNLEVYCTTVDTALMLRSVGRAKFDGLSEDITKHRRWKVA